MRKRPRRSSAAETISSPPTRARPPGLPDRTIISKFIHTKSPHFSGDGVSYESAQPSLYSPHNNKEAKGVPRPAGRAPFAVFPPFSLKEAATKISKKEFCFLLRGKPFCGITAVGLLDDEIAAALQVAARGPVGIFYNIMRRAALCPALVKLAGGYRSLTMREKFLVHRVVNSRGFNRRLLWPQGFRLVVSPPEQNSCRQKKGCSQSGPRCFPSVSPVHGSAPFSHCILYCLKDMPPSNNLKNSGAAFAGL